MIYARFFAADALKSIAICISILLISLLALLAIRHDSSSDFISEMLSLSRATLGQAGVLIAISCFNFTYYSWCKDGRLEATALSGKSMGGLMWPALTMCLIVALLTNAMLPPFSMPSAAHVVGDSKWTMVLSDNEFDYSLIEMDRHRPGLSSISTISKKSLFESFPFLKSSSPLNNSLAFTIMFFMLCTIFNISRQSEPLSPNSRRLFLLPIIFVFSNTAANRIFAFYPQIAINVAIPMLIVFYALVLQYTKILDIEE